MKFKDFLIKVLNGTAIGIVVALIPNAVLGAILKPWASNPLIAKLMFALVVMQALVSVVIGVLVGLQFGFDGMKSTIIGAAAFIASGVVKVVPATLADGRVVNYYHMAGTGDLINVMIFAGVAAWVTLILQDKFGSVKVILQPIVVGTGIGFIGLLALPYVSYITSLIGDVIMHFTTLQPLLMCILITISFGVIIVSPISTVAIGLAVGLQGLASGAANMGVTTTALVLVVGSIMAKNKSGVTLAVLLGGMKMMMPNVFRNVLLYLPIVLTAVIGAIGVRYLGIQGTPQSAGFGIVGLVGPLKAYELLVTEVGSSAALLRICLAYFVLPLSAAIGFNYLFIKVLKLFSVDAYKFNS